MTDRDGFTAISLPCTGTSLDDRCMATKLDNTVIDPKKAKAPAFPDPGHAEDDPWPRDRV